MKDNLEDEIIKEADISLKKYSNKNVSSSVERNKKLAGKFEEEAKKAKKKNKNKLYNVLIALFAAVFLFSAGYIGLYYYRTYKNEKNYKKLRGMVVSVDEENPPDDAIVSEVEEPEQNTSADNTESKKLVVKKLFADVDGVKVQYKFKDIYTENKDFIGWLKIEGTNIDYPVMLTPEDEQYYLRRDFNGDYSIAGTLFVDTSSDVKRPSDNIIIYGHHMKTKTMFRELVDYEDEDFYEKHKYITFDTIYGDNTYEVIAAFKTNIKDKDDTSFKYYNFFWAASEEDFDYYVDNVRYLTNYNIAESAKYGDKLLTLSTCSYHTDNGRFVVVAKKIK
ncbi:sortase B [Eubacterium ruminantium]|nr:sortase B [Eubacterium ruminantium]